ncbi:MAG TPA: AbrB/MazE/SpoVT family DNA-binding domain-containing protein [Planctomycetota bacterium]|nr:AbrB/MazE/SpoVT family DNA-binding domain-containing protein [Planctomycetota bacterium]
MAKVTAKLQVTIPKALATQYGIEPGDEIVWQASGEAIRLVPASLRKARLSPKERLALFDAATERQRQRQREATTGPRPRGKDRGWTREELYTRGRAR